jgi:hypothetical protein
MRKKHANNQCFFTEVNGCLISGNPSLTFLIKAAPVAFSHRPNSVVGSRAPTTQRLAVELQHLCLGHHQPWIPVALGRQPHSATFLLQAPRKRFNKLNFQTAPHFFIDG